MLRLFRSIEGEPKDDLVLVARTIIDDERKKGHVRLAQRLTVILDRNMSAKSGITGELKKIFSAPLAIPTDKRYKIPLATEIDRTKLRHEMVLSPVVEAKISRIEKEYIARERLAHHGLSPRRRILLYGSPGCGKSMAAERIAWNVGLPFLKVKFEAVVSSYLGESASNLKSLFEAIESYPCVLLLDEFDFIAKARDGRQDVGEMHRVVNILLNVLEDYGGPGIVVATTNLEGAIDKALFRRFDDIIELEKPGVSEIEIILRSTLGSIQVASDIDWKNIAERMFGFSAALIVKIANDAAKLCVISGDRKLEHRHLGHALDDNQQYFAS